MVSWTHFRYKPWDTNSQKNHWTSPLYIYLLFWKVNNAGMDIAGYHDCGFIMLWRRIIYMSRAAGFAREGSCGLCPGVPFMWAAPPRTRPRAVRPRGPASRYRLMCGFPVFTDASYVLGVGCFGLAYILVWNNEQKIFYSGFLLLFSCFLRSHGVCNSKDSFEAI